MAAISKVFEVLSKVPKHPMPLNDYANLQEGAHLAGRAINIAKTNVPHALSYYLTAKYGVPHGLAVALFYEPYLQLLDTQQEKMQTMQRASFTFVSETLCGAGRYRVGSWTALLRRLELPTSLASLGHAIDRDACIGSVNLERLQNFALPVDLGRFVP